MTSCVQMMRYVELHTSKDHILHDVWCGYYDHLCAHILQLSRNTSYQIRKIFLMVCRGLFGTRIFKEQLFPAYTMMAFDKVINVKIEFSNTLIDFFSI